MNFVYPLMIANFIAVEYTSSTLVCVNAIPSSLVLKIITTKSLIALIISSGCASSSYPP